MHLSGSILVRRSGWVRESRQLLTQAARRLLLSLPLRSRPTRIACPISETMTRPNLNEVRCKALTNRRRDPSSSNNLTCKSQPSHNSHSRLNHFMNRRSDSRKRTSRVSRTNSFRSCNNVTTLRSPLRPPRIRRRRTTTVGRIRLCRCKITCSPLALRLSATRN